MLVTTGERGLAGVSNILQSVVLNRLTWSAMVLRGETESIYVLSFVSNMFACRIARAPNLCRPCIPL